MLGVQMASLGATPRTGWEGGTCHAQLPQGSTEGLEAGVSFAHGRNSRQGSGVGVSGDVLKGG